MPEKDPLDPYEYDLKIDIQVEKFIETKQKLTYFLITASVAVIAFLVDFVVKLRGEVGGLVWLAVLSAVAGLLTAGFSLLNIRFELKSYRLHLKLRYEKKTWDSLKPDEQKDWDRVNRFAARFLESAFVFLFIEIALAIAFFILFFL